MDNSLMMTKKCGIKPSCLTHGRNIIKVTTLMKPTGLFKPLTKRPQLKITWWYRHCTVQEMYLLQPRLARLKCQRPDMYIWKKFSVAYHYQIGKLSNVNIEKLYVFSVHSFKIFSKFTGKHGWTILVKDEQCWLTASQKYWSICLVKDPSKCWIWTFQSADINLFHYNV